MLKQGLKLTLRACLHRNAVYVVYTTLIFGAGPTLANLVDCQAAATARPRGTWQSVEARRQFVVSVGEKLGFRTPEDYYRMSGQNLVDAGGAALYSNYYKSSLMNVLLETFPDFAWQFWRLDRTPKGFWNNDNNLRAYLDWLGERLNYKNLDDWYRVEYTDFKENFGGGLVSAYTVREILAKAYPDHEWLPWRFRQLAAGFWENKNNRVQYLEWLRKRLDIHEVSDWYDISMSDFADNWGYGFIDHYGNSILRALRDVYPETPFEEWRFHTLRGIWTKETQRKFLDWISADLGLTDPGEWYDINLNQIRARGGAHLLNNYYGGSIYKMLKSIYPEYSWQKEPFQKTFRSQDRLVTVVRQIYPDSEIIVNYKHPDLRFLRSGRKMEFDVWIPDLNLAFEYQGEQHYYLTNWLSEEQFAAVQMRDREKAEAAQAHGITLIPVKYTWNRSRTDLEKIIAAGGSRPSASPRTIIPGKMPNRIRSTAKPVQRQTVDESSPSPETQMAPLPFIPIAIKRSDIWAREWNEYLSKYGAPPSSAMADGKNILRHALKGFDDEGLTFFDKLDQTAKLPLLQAVFSRLQLARGSLQNDSLRAKIEQIVRSVDLLVMALESLDEKHKQNDFRAFFLSEIGDTLQIYAWSRYKRDGDQFLDSLTPSARDWVLSLPDKLQP